MPLIGELTMRSGILCAAGLISALVMPPTAAPAATTQDNFLLRTAGDLAAVCSPAPDDPLMAAAVGFCEGVALGVYRSLDQTQAGFRAKLFCMPSPGPSRSEAIASFVAWVQANPTVAPTEPADAILRYLQQTYPCAGGRP
jgi:Rap1a immunity proteins